MSFRQYNQDGLQILRSHSTLKKKSDEIHPLIILTSTLEQQAEVALTCAEDAYNEYISAVLH